MRPLPPQAAGVNRPRINPGPCESSSEDKPVSSVQDNKYNVVYTAPVGHDLEQDELTPVNTSRG